MFLNRLIDGPRQNGDSVFAPFAVTDQGLVSFEVQVVDSQRQRFHQAQSRAIEKRRNQVRNARHQAQDAPYVLACQDQRQSFRPFRPNRRLDPIKGSSENVAVQKQDGGQRLVLGGIALLVFEPQSTSGIRRSLVRPFHPGDASRETR